MSRICIIALIGLPAAGKTTFCQHLLTVSAGLPFNIAHLCFDQLMHLNIDPSNEPTLVINFKDERLRILSLLQSMVDAFKLQTLIKHLNLNTKINLSCNNSKDYVIFCDDNNYYTSMRYKIYQLCKTNQLNFGQIYLSIDLELALSRNAQRNKDTQVPINIVQQMFRRLELPNVEKNSWEILTLKLDSCNCSKFSTSTILDFIAKVFAHSVPTPTFSYAITEQKQELQSFSMSHHLDVILRRRIKEMLALESSTEAKKSKALVLNIQRKDILQQFGRNMKGQTESTSLEKLNDMCKLLH